MDKKQLMEDVVHGATFLLGAVALLCGVALHDWLIAGCGVVLYAMGHFRCNPQYYTNEYHGDIDE